MLTIKLGFASGCLILAGCSTVNQKEYIPSLSYSQATLLTGASLSDSESTSALMMIKENTTTPSGETKALNECLVKGIARGDLAPERIRINLSAISCAAGKDIFVPVAGWVVGEDGRSGIKGQLVTHTDGNSSTQKLQSSQVKITVEPNRNVTIIFESGFWK